MFASIFLLATAISANSLNVIDGEAIFESEYIYPVAGIAAETSTGMEISNVKSDYAIGDFLTEIPYDADGKTIDWERTYAAITNNVELYKNKVYCVPNASVDTERIVFTQGGAIELTWYYKNPDGTPVEEGSTQVYEIAENAAERPNRLYWTSAPFLGPTIDLTGKFVRLFGNPNLLHQVVEVNETLNMTNIVSGIVLMSSGNSQYLEARARVLDVDAQRYDGPSGQFVLAYYADGNYNKFIGSVVVEVGRPDTKILDAHVGDELLPTGDGWSVQGLLPYPKDGKGGIDEVTGDAASPHMALNECKRADNGDKVIVAYAISPNDKTTRDYTNNAPTKNDIFWEKPDLTGTLWPFEEVLYNVTWNREDPMVVCGDLGVDSGMGIFIPTNYTVEVCSYQDPSDTAFIDSQNQNVVRIQKEGRFTLKLFTTSKVNEDVWYLPMSSKSRVNPAVVNTNSTYDVAYAIGRALEPLDVGFAGTASNAYLAVDSALGGYINAAVSTGKNWNPRLYHAPEPPRANDIGVSFDSIEKENNDDPFSKLASAIYSVGESEQPIEVWWRGRKSIPSRLFGATLPVEYPVAVQRYRIREPLPDEVREIALASQRGSAGLGYASSLRGLRFMDDSAYAFVNDGDLFTLPEQGFAFSIDVNPCPSEVPFMEPAYGTILSLVTDNSALFLYYDSEHDSADGMRGISARFLGEKGGEDDYIDRTFSTAIHKDQWSQFVCKVVRNSDGGKTLTLGVEGREQTAFDLPADSHLLEGQLRELWLGIFPDVLGSPTGSAVDNLCFYDGDALLANWTFEPDCVDESANIVFDDTTRGRVLELSSSMRVIPGGAPVVGTTSVPYNDDVIPEIYRQTDRNGVGYHLNLAHAFTRPGDVDGSYTTWALRSDLGENLCDNLIFTMYSAGGKGAQATYYVVETNDFYQTMESSTTVGHQFLPPAPLCYLDDYWNERTTWLSLYSNTGDLDKCIVYRDRKLNDWARRDGGGYAFYFYKPKPTFDWPENLAQTVAEYVPWQDHNSDMPMPWKWTATWPDDNEIPTMKVGQTLTEAVNGLPEVWNMASCGVIYPESGVVDLVDPTVAQTAALPISTSVPVDYGFTVGNSGTCQLRNGKYYFTGLPPSISDRFYIDTNADTSKNMVLIGTLTKPATGNPYLRLNVLNPQERQALIDICVNATPEKREEWKNAVETLATATVLPSKELDSLSVWETQYQVDGVETTTIAARRPNYLPVDHYALMATGNNVGYVVLIENDSPDTAMVASGDPINLKVIKVLPELYNGTIMPLIDPMNKLSEQLTLQYNEPFGDATKDFIFEWRRRGPEANGTINTNYDQWDIYRSDEGLTSFTIGTNGTSLAELVNKYYVMRYKAKPGTVAAETCGTDWSAFTKYTLAEGWVQRVLNAVTPFSQRMSDFYTNEAEIRYSMLEQIGGPYNGDVALNDANLNSIGLLQLYRTVLNKAEKMSLDMDVQDVDVNKQLLLATSRIADLYMLLGAEAYSDAKNPLVSSGLDSAFLDQLQQLPSSTFCFQNQVRTLLDEELALLRGRDNSVQNPDMQTSPIYNRLIWNFTKGITEGEVAYVNNYGIRPDSTGDITVDSAAAQYPQGHGDAYGHYLSAVKGYYHLLRNPNFGWSASMMEMMVSASVVNEDYQDEQKFADAAVKLAQVGLDTVDLTARKAWRDNAGEMRSAYFDGSAGQNFGYGETASRAALGAAYNWLAVNSILPTNAAPESVYVDKGIKQITRETATQLDELATAYSRIEDKVNTLDAGLNPLGLSQNTIPMDLDPTDLANRNSHFEQILERAEKALANCDTVLEWANKYGARLQQIQNSENDAIANQAAQELAYKNMLISIYGTPFSGDIGVGGTYEQGYDGPDLYHYMWMNLEEFGIDQKELAAGAQNVELVYKGLVDDIWVGKGRIENKVSVENGVTNIYNNVYHTVATKELNYTVAQNGIVLPAIANPGLRAMEGSIQSAYRDYLTKYIAFSKAKLAYYTALYGADENIAVYIAAFNSKHKYYNTKILMNTIVNSSLFLLNTVTSLAYGKRSINDLLNNQMNEMLNAIASPTVGLAVNPDSKAIMAAAMLGPMIAQEAVMSASDITAHKVATVLGSFPTTLELVFGTIDAYQSLNEARTSLISTIEGELLGVSAAAGTYRDAIIAMQSAEAVYRAEIAKGDQLKQELVSWRAKAAGDAAQLRYLDMYARVQRNNVLTKYNTAFETAQRYVWELAKVYDYETGLLSGDPQGAQKFYAEIIGSRQLGYKGVSTSAATDKGLYDIVNRMKENFAVLKPRLGINNPDSVAKEFSLRYELFRIDPGVRGDSAWKTELRKYWSDDINSDADFRRYCQPLADAGVLKEPGLVIPFSTTIETAKNFFGRNLQGGDHAYSSADYATKIAKVGVTLVGYDRLTQQTSNGLAAEPNIYLVPVGNDYLRAPTASRQILGYKVIDQVLPLPYAIGNTELDDENYLSTFSGLDGTNDSCAKIRRHSTLVADGGTYSTRLCGRSVWNDRWLLVIPAASLNANRTEGLETFIKGVSDIKLGIQSYSRAGN